MRIVIQADGRKIAANTAGQPLTSGSRGVEAQFDLSADYAGLAVTAAFVAGEAKVDVVLTASSRCVVPWEVLETAGNMLLIGVVGKDGAGNIVIPTLWCKVGLIECGTVVSGIDPQDPTPDIAAQLLQIAQETVERAETAETGAESAKTAAETAQAGAEAAKQAIEDLGVTAHEDPNGPSVQKIVDEETGAITMDFGFKPAPVTSVNGKTGDVQLTLDDIPDTETYARTTPAQVRQIGTNADDINAIEAKIPPQASATNQLADKDFVNSSINSSTAFFRGSFATHAALFAVPWQTTNPAAANYVTNNDYAYVADDETHNDEAWRYIYVLQPGGTGNGWQPQFKVNDSPLTAAQLAALNSGATAEIIASIADKYELPANGIPKADLAAGVQQSLDKADTALQPAALEPYRTAADQDTIDAAQDEKIDAAAQATEETTVGPAAIATFDASAANMPLKSLLVDIEPVQDLHGYDHPWPGGGGKNIISNSKSVSDGYIDNKFLNKDGSTSNDTSWYVSVYIPINSDAAYTWSSEANINSPAVCYYDSSKNFISGETAGSGLPRALTIPSTAAFIRASQNKNNQRCQIEKGTTATSWSPYSNICPISGWTGAEIQRTGKNLFDQTQLLLAEGWAFNSDGFYYGRRDALHNAFREGFNKIPKFKENTQYTLSFIMFCSAATSVTRIGFIYTDGTKTNIAQSPTTATNYVLVSERGKTIKTIYAEYGASGSVLTYLKDMQVEEGTIATSYVPYLGKTLSITFPSEAGTVYDGTLDLVAGELSTRPYYASYNGEALVGPWISSMDAYVPGSTPTIGAQVVDMGGAITNYQLTQQEVATLLGINNIWADCGDVTVTYGAYLETLKSYADRLGDSILSAIAPLETTYTASRAYAVGSYLFVGTKFYKVTASIGSGDTINPGTNVTQTTVAEQLIALAGN